MNVEFKVDQGTNRVTDKKLKPSALWDTPAYRNWYHQTGTPDWTFDPNKGDFVPKKPV